MTLCRDDDRIQSNQFVTANPERIDLDFFDMRTF